MVLIYVRHRRVVIIGCTPHTSGRNTMKTMVSMMTSSNGNIFHVTGHLCREFTGHRWIPRTKANDAELWYFFYLCLNKRLSKQWWGWWFETPACPLWRHCNATNCEAMVIIYWDDTARFIYAISIKRRHASHLYLWTVFICAHKL